MPCPKDPTAEAVYSYTVTMQCEDDTTYDITLDGVDDDHAKEEAEADCQDTAIRTERGQFIYHNTLNCTCEEP